MLSPPSHSREVTVVDGASSAVEQGGADSFPLDICNDAGNTVTEKGHQDAAELP